MTERSFKSSNGITIMPGENGVIHWAPGHEPRLVSVALREYFQHERDQELGRWRDPENPDYVVYLEYESGGIRVLNERTGVGGFWRREYIGDLTSNSAHDTAQRYFAAHPEPKPWHDAQPGEVWELTEEDTRTYLMTVAGHFTDEHGSVLSPDCFTAGRRIYPQEEA